MIQLRDLTAVDIPLINAWRADRDIADTLGGPFRHLNIETDVAWFEQYMRSRSQNVRMGIVLGETALLIGVVYLLDIHPINRTCEHGIMIGAKEHWGKGYGTTAQRMTLEHAFVDLNLHRVFVHVQTESKASIRVHEKNGFVREGVMREHVYKCGKYRDDIVMGILADEWFALEAARKRGQPS